MLIRVMYRDNTYDMVKDIVLDDLVQSKKILKFYRAGRWAVIGSDPIRGMGGNDTGYRRRRYETRMNP